MVLVKVKITFLLLIFATIGLLLASRQIEIPAMPESNHASMHEEANMIRQCSQDPANLKSIWINASGERLNCLVQIEDNKVGNRVIQWGKKCGWFEVTAYMIGSGDPSGTIETLVAKGCIQVWP